MMCKWFIIVMAIAMGMQVVILEGSVDEPSVRCSEEAVVWQPQFRWADGEVTRQGTSSFVRGPGGEVLALTSAHFIRFTGPRLVDVSWLDIRTGVPIATSTKSWGMPGKEGSFLPLDLRTDYLLMAVEGTVPPESVLEMDDRNMPEVGEYVWFPNKNPETACGYDVVEGVVTKASDAYCIVALDNWITVRTRSGTPAVSRKTGKVIGILTGAEKRVRMRQTIIYLAPAASIYKAVISAGEHPDVRRVIRR